MPLIHTSEVYVALQGGAFIDMPEELASPMEVIILDEEEELINVKKIPF